MVGVNLKLPSPFSSNPMFVTSSWICEFSGVGIAFCFLEYAVMMSFTIFIFRYHHLKLYPEDESGPQSTKKPVVVESYDEIVFPDPSESFFARVQNHPAVIVPRMPAGFNISLPCKSIIYFLLSDVWMILSFLSGLLQHHQRILMKRREVIPKITC